MQTKTDRTTARFAHKIDRQWQKGAPRSMPRHWRMVCLLALASAPERAEDAKFHRAVVAALRFALPHPGEADRTTAAWAANPENIAALAVDLYPVIRAHARK